MRKSLSLILSPLWALALSGCFTGVEYTPKITASDVKKEPVTVTAEDTFLRHTADAPLAQWQPGKRLRVTDSRISRAFLGADRAPGEELEGRDLTVAGWQAARSVTSDAVTDLYFTTPSGATVCYRVNASPEETAAKSSLAVPFTVQHSTIGAISDRMTGHTYYILTDTWRDDADSPRQGRKFVPVHIDSVSPGNSFFPVKVSFTAKDSIGGAGCVFLYPGAKGEAPRTFSHLFSFADPRLAHPEISDSVWASIIRGDVAEGMTRAECRLALGEPKEVNRAASNTYIHEVWLYDTGIYLLFEDGILKRHRFAK